MLEHFGGKDMFDNFGHFEPLSGECEHQGNDA